MQVVLSVCVHGVAEMCSLGGGGGVCLVFFFNDTATTEIYTLSLHDALPICRYRYCQNYCQRGESRMRIDSNLQLRFQDTPNDKSIVRCEVCGYNC